MKAATRRFSSAVLILLAVAVSRPQAAQHSAPPAATGPISMALIESWPDGRTLAALTTARRASMWTTNFPRIEGFRPPAGTQPVAGVQLAWVLVDGNIRVEVSVLPGNVSAASVPVATAIVVRGSTVTIDELSKFGVQPLTLSMVDAGPFSPYLPIVTSVSPNIEVQSVQILSAPYAGYRITLRNLGTKGVSTVQVQSYRGQDQAASRLECSHDGRPMMSPGGTYAFDLNLTSGWVEPNADLHGWAPAPLDRIELDVIRWDDGTYDGTPPYPQVDRYVEGTSGVRLQLRRIIDQLKLCLAEQSDANLVSSVKEALSQLADNEPDQVAEARVAMQATKKSALSDLARYESDMSSKPSPTQWLADLIRFYEMKLARLSPL